MYALIYLLMVSPFSFAGGDWVGNGGSGVFCSDTQKTEVLDYYEGRRRRGLTVDLGDENLNYQSKVLIALDRLSQINPTRARLYRTWYQAFSDDTYWIQEGRLTPIPDVGYVILPGTCKLVQIVAQRSDNQILPGDKRYLIDLSLWKELSETEKAGLILHELIYREALTSPNETSAYKVRYFNQVLSNKQFENLKPVELFDLVRLVGLETVDYFGQNIFVATARRDVRGGPLVEAKVQQSAGFYGAESTWVSLNGRTVTFHPSGRLKSFPLDSKDKLRILVQGKYVIPMQVYNGESTEVEFYENGVFANGPLRSRVQISIKSQEVTVSNYYGKISFWPNGALQVAYVIDDVNYKGRFFDITGYGYVHLDQNEDLIEGNIQITQASKAAYVGSEVLEDVQWTVAMGRNDQDTQLIMNFFSGLPLPRDRR